jgi:hypothetical protein
MDDMGTPGPNHPAHRGLKGKRTEGQFDNVLDLTASRKVKDRTGRSVPIRLASGADSAELTKHEDEAMALGNSGKDK